MKFKKLLITILASLVFISLTTLGIQSYLHSKDHTEIKSLLANLKQLDGTEPHFTLDSSKPKKNYVILHFWASWCGPCQAEMPTVFSAHSKLAEKFQILLISADDNSSDALTFLKKVGNPPSTDFTWWDANKKILSPLEVFKLPETLIFDSHFNLIRKIAGPMNWEDPKNLDYFNRLK